MLYRTMKGSDIRWPFSLSNIPADAIKNIWKNYLWDLKNNILERFEPNGQNQPINFDYNPKLLDTFILNYLFLNDFC